MKWGISDIRDWRFGMKFGFQNHNNVSCLKAVSPSMTSSSFNWSLFCPAPPPSPIFSLSCVSIFFSDQVWSLNERAGWVRRQGSPFSVFLHSFFPCLSSFIIKVLKETRTKRQGHWKQRKRAKKKGDFSIFHLSSHCPLSLISCPERLQPGIPYLLSLISCLLSLSSCLALSLGQSLVPCFWFLVLSCLMMIVLSYLILSCLILSCLVLSFISFWLSTVF